MKTIIRFAVVSDLPYIVDLSKKETHSIGFIPKIAYEAAISGVKKGKRWSDVCKDKIWVAVENGDCLGFVMASWGRIGKSRNAKINQICLQQDARMLERGRMLLKAVEDYGKNIGVSSFSCGCADDLESNKFWNAMDFIKVGERKGS